MALWRRICPVLLLTSLVQSDPVTLQIYKSSNYSSLSDVVDNAAQYKNELVNFFHPKDQNYIGKVDKNLDIIINIELGQPLQRFLASVDTSFPALWIPSYKCVFSFSCWSKNTYTESVDYEADKTDDDQVTQDIAYGDGSTVQGLVGFDTLTVGTDIALTFHGVHFMEATSIPKGDFYYRSADGVFGLGFPSKDVQILPPFYTMLDRGLLDNSMFSYIIAGKHGLLMLGGFNDDYFDCSSLQYHSLTNDTRRWMLNVQSIIIAANESSAQFCSTDCNVMIDTATAFIAAPAEVLKVIASYNSIQYAGDMMTVPCTGIASMPKIRISIDGQVTILSSKDYVIKIDNTCALSFVESPKGFWIFGNLFLIKWYTIFDVGSRRIGFAKLSP